MANKSTRLEDTGERMIPGFHKGTVLYAEHLTRYTSAQPLAEGKVVLDIASGSGYGTKILAETAKKVYGVDVDAPSIEYAKENFAGKNIEYRVGDGEKIPLDDNSIDVVITFETIEHIPDYQQFMREVKRVLKPDGLAVISTPNEKEFTKGNHYHLHEFEYDELLKLVKQDFNNVDSYFQATWVSVMLGPEEYVRKEGQFDITTFNYMPLAPEKDLYFYMLCSNRKITEKIKPVNAFGGHYSARELTDIHDLKEKVIGDHQKLLKQSNQQVLELSTELGKANEKIQKLSAELSGLKNSFVHRAASKIKRRHG